ncbi:MAG: replicative DNA helicase, partial [Candidatus Paceibacterota bacterium]
VLEQVRGLAYLSSLTNSVPTSAHISSYAKIVQKKKMLRDMIDAAHHIIGLSSNDEDDVENLLDEAEKKLFSVSQKSLTKNFLPISATLTEAMDRITNQDAGVLRGLKTDYHDLDETLGGLQKSDLIVLAARPSVGKTAFAINLALRVAKQGVPVGIFSMEMSIDQVVDRLISAASGVSLWKLRTGKLSHREEHDDFLRITTACDELKSMPIFIDDTPSPNILQMRAMARRLMVEQGGLGLIVVDYLQLMAGRKNYESPVQQVTEISRGLKGLAKELKIPILAISQLSRAVEQREGHKPRLSDLRDSGCLTGDSLIMRADTGELLTIKKLAERQEQKPIPVFSLDNNLRLTIQPLVKAFANGKKKTYELLLRSGRTLKASANHPFYRMDGWHALEELKVGNHISIPREINPINKKQTASDNELILLAHLLGDGCILPRQPFHYTSADPQNLEIVSKTAKALFNIQPRIIKQKNWWHVYLPSPYHLTHNKKHPISIWFEKLGIKRAHSFDKVLPAEIFRQPREKVALFLKHLWSTDGNISWKIIKGRKPAGAIYYSSTSKTLIQQVQHLLLRFGIQSNIRISQKGSYKPNHNLHIQGSVNQLIFLREVSCYGQRGQIIPSLIKALEKIIPNVNLDVIPKEAWKLLVETARVKAQISMRALSSGLQIAHNGTALYKNGVGRDRMRRLALVLRNKSMEQLAESDVYWDEIVSIKEVGAEEVYDATVAGTHNFIANDIIVHNSIEQDADLVMFIHREDKVNMEKAKENNTVNMAQLVIAKHRNGPTGEIEFRIDPESLRFMEVDKTHSNPPPEYI